MAEPKSKTLVPLIWGVLIGALVVPIVAFSADWVVTTSTNDREVQQAFVDGQANICAALVQRHREATGDTSDLSGYKGRDARAALAKTFAVALPGQADADSKVISACADKLDKKNV